MRLQMRVIFVLKGGSLLLIAKRAIMLHLQHMFVKLIGYRWMGHGTPDEGIGRMWCVIMFHIRQESLHC